MSIYLSIYVGLWKVVHVAMYAYVGLCRVM